MLILTRKLDERIVIDGEIVLTVVKVGAGWVKLGIECPDGHTVWREELLDQPLGR